MIVLWEWKIMEKYAVTDNISEAFNGVFSGPTGDSSVED